MLPEENNNPSGNVPLMMLNAGVGKPVAVKLNACPTSNRNVTLLMLVIDGGLLTVIVKNCVAGGAMPFAALKVTRDCPPLTSDGTLALNVPVPLPRSVKVMPKTSPDSEIDGLG